MPPVVGVCGYEVVLALRCCSNLSNPNKPVQRKHNSIHKSTSCVPRLGRSTTDLSCEIPYNLWFLQAQASTPSSTSSSIDSSFPSPLSSQPFISTFPFPVQSPSPTFILQIKMGRKFWWGHLSMWLGSTSWGSGISIKIQTFPGQSITFPPFVQLKGCFPSNINWVQLLPFYNLWSIRYT